LPLPRDLVKLVVGNVVHDGHRAAADDGPDHDGGDKVSCAVPDEPPERGTEPARLTCGHEHVVAGRRSRRRQRRAARQLRGGCFGR
jgi:hypothetical protein